MSKIVTIYCEGKENSHDKDIINKIIEGLTIEIVPIGSVRGANAIIQYRENGGFATKSDFYLFFRDRDFDKALPENICLEIEKNIAYSYRNTIENYFFSPLHIFNFTTQKNEAQKYGITDEETAKQKLIEAAEKIKVYQAIRHTMGKMRTDKTNFGTKLTKDSGILPDSLDKDFCVKQALDKINEAKGYADAWTKKSFLEIFEAFLIKFDKDFMDNLDFLCYFQGKDLAKSLGNLLPNFPIQGYYNYTKKVFDYTQFPDLVELRKLLEQNI